MRLNINLNQHIFQGKKLAAITLGCEKNRVDTEEILGYLSVKGFVLTDSIENADVVIVNTCGFIEDAQQESVNTLLQLSTQSKKSNLKIIAAGCLVELYGSKILDSLPNIDGAIGVHSYHLLDYFLAQILNNKRTIIQKKPSKNYYQLAPRVLTSPAHSAVIKIAEGCDNHCHYCLIPTIRGHYRSRPPQSIVEEIRSLVFNGTREIVLIAQDTTAYGLDNENYPDLVGLIKNILTINKYFWLRLMYTYPSRITKPLIDLIASEQRICNYIDLPIQHSSDLMLERMGRKYSKQDLIGLLKNIRGKIPEITLRTTCMTGFPGERRRHFDDLLDFIEQNRFEHLGAFKYSRQDSCTAAKYPEQVPSRIAKRRYSELMLKQKSISYYLNRQMIGKQLTVLVEGRYHNKNGCYYGRSEYQAPDVDGTVIFSSAEALIPGTWVLVKIYAASPYTLLGTRPEIIDENTLNGEI